MFTPVHRHLIVFAAVRNPIMREYACGQFLLDTIKNAGMTCISGPHVVNVKDAGNEGLTGTATLAESHTSIHIWEKAIPCLLYTSPSPRDRTRSRMPSSA